MCQYLQWTTAVRPYPGWKCVEGETVEASWSGLVWVEKGYNILNYNIGNYILFCCGIVNTWLVIRPLQNQNQKMNSYYRTLVYSYNVMLHTVEFGASFFIKRDIFSPRGTTVYFLVISFLAIKWICHAADFVQSSPLCHVKTPDHKHCHDDLCRQS